MRWLLTLALLALAAWPAAAQENKADGAVKKELAKLEGTWTIVKMEVSNKSLLEKDKPEAKLVIKDGKVTSDAKETPADDADLSKILDPSKKPKQITIPNFEGGDPKKGVTLIGIYELSGNELRVCVQVVETANLKEREKERPTAFDSKQGVLLVFKREKKD
jgi:uncharacterized protein (TIGR03067 family)